jgi:alpha-2-macroglobulin
MLSRMAAKVTLGAWLWVLLSAQTVVAQSVLDRTPEAASAIASVQNKVKAYAAAVAKPEEGLLRAGVSVSPEEKAVAANPDSRAALAAYGGWLFREKRFGDAAAIAWKVYISADTGKAKGGALSLLAESRLGQGGYDEAVAAYKLAAAADTENTRIKNRLAALQERTLFRVKDVSVDSERDLPQACVVMSGDIRQPVRAEDYLLVAPKADVDVYATADRLCAKGLLHGQSYKLTVRAGLSGAKGGTLRAAESRDVDVGNRGARIIFGEGKYVLPRTGTNAVPLKSVNIGRVNLELHSVNERALLKALTERSFPDKIENYTYSDFKNDTGRKVWKGFVEPAQKLNREVVTNISLYAMLKKKPTGLYMLTATTPDEQRQIDADEFYDALSTQWVIVSDIGLLSLQGSDGLTIFTRSLASGNAASDITLELIARDNSVLGTVKTNSEGKARFFPGLMRGAGAAEPMFVLARGSGGDINILRLTGPALDLSDRGIDGAPAITTALDAFVYTERGIYRPGEKVRLSALLRNDKMQAQGALPLLFSVRRPDGSELFKLRSTGDALGAYALDINIPGGARSGMWSVAAYADPDGEALGAANFQVEDFVPQRIELLAKAAAPLLAVGAPFEAVADAKYYYGPAASDLSGESNADVVRDDAAFVGYEGFRFGRVEEGFSPISTAPQAFTTGADGTARLIVPLGDVPQTTYPLKARMGITLFDVGGRPVYTQVQTKLRTLANWIGLRSKASGSIGENDTVAYELVALTADGKPIAGRKIDVQWLREDYDTSWYQENGKWFSRTSVFDTLMRAQTVTTNASGKANIALALPGGRYRVQVKDAAGESVTSDRFYAGWWSSGETSNAPDALEVNLEKNDLSDGERLSLFVKAPFDGPALVTIVGNGTPYSASATVSKAGNRITLPVNKDWGAGGYVMVTGFRPNAGAVSPLPVRAMGLAWFGIDQKRRTIPVTLTTPKAAEPRQKITLPVQVAGASGRIGMTIAAVDEGILALTRYKSPKPEQHYLARRQLGVDVRDLYGQLITPAAGALGNLREGGDAAMENASGVTTRSSKTVALWTTQVTLDGSGKGSVTLDLPDFAGRLRLMAVAYTEAQVGSGEANLIVRDPVVAELTLPRFMAPGDGAQAMLTVHNVSGRAQPVAIALSGEGGLQLTNPLKGPVTLKDGEQRRFSVPLKSAITGDNKAIVTATIGGKQIVRIWDLAVRPLTTIETRRDMKVGAPGQTLTLSKELLAGFVAGSTRASLTIGVRPEFDVPALLDALNQYPYGCSEQITSAAMPLIYFSDVAQLWSKKADANDLRSRIEQAAIKLLERQDYRGGIGLWSANDSVDPWVSAYVFDFLTRARGLKYYVPAQGYENLKRFLQSLTAGEGGDKIDVQARTYALYALARSGDARASDVRYFADQNASKLQTKLAVAQLAAALATSGETARATAMFASAARKVRPKDYWKDYGSDMRDAAAALALRAESSSDGKLLLGLAEQIEKQIARDKRWYWSTQEASSLLMATHAITKLGGDVQVSAGGAQYGPAAKPFRRVLTISELASGFQVRNDSKGPVRIATLVRGAPIQLQGATQNGFTIARRLLTFAGAPANLAAIKQNDRLVVVIEGSKIDGAIGQTLITDLLPAGLEIESSFVTMSVNNGEDEAGAPTPPVGLPNWLAGLTWTRFQDARDDRFVAAIDTEYQTSFKIAYLVRAITPGRYIHPGVFIEDMYQPRFFSRSAPGVVTIGAK